MTRMSRRRALQLVGAAPAAAALVWTRAEAAQAHTHAQQARAAAARQSKAYKPKFFTAHEYATVAVLVDLIIPKDERSGSATDAGVPEFMDFMVIDQPRRQVAMRGGLALVDRMCEEQFGKRFVACSDQQRHQLLDQIAYTNDVPPARSQAVAFFSSFRDLTASGFWTTKMGIADLQYQGNAFLDEWNGCPEEALNKLGVRY
jgi:gluconate 2-dehydrogenase subunit 3-like protein